MAANFEDLVSIDNPVFRSYAFWSLILVVKMLLMAPLTGRMRFKTKTPIPEDVPKEKRDKIKSNEDVERVRRAHRNDLENILPFFTLGFIYILTNPEASLAILLFRIVAIARISHTLIYAVFVIPQPARAIAWFIPYGISFYMAFKSITYFI